MIWILPNHSKRELKMRVNRFRNRQELLVNVIPKITFIKTLINFPASFCLMSMLNWWRHFQSKFFVPLLSGPLIILAGKKCLETKAANLSDKWSFDEPSVACRVVSSLSIAYPNVRDDSTAKKASDQACSQSESWTLSDDHHDDRKAIHWVLSIGCYPLDAIQHQLFGKFSNRSNVSFEDSRSLSAW